jgi:endonuclease/exonuclease/phosphatase family metal-dependent hydrolase
MTLRVLQQNFRRSDLPEFFPYRLWAVRRPYMMRHIRNVQPAIIGCQELTIKAAADVLIDLGSHWARVDDGHNVRLLYDAAELQIEGGTQLAIDLPSGLRKRYLILARFTHIPTGFGCWVGSVHLASGGEEEPKPDALRRAQMTIIAEKVPDWIAAHPHPEDGKPNLVLMGDLNDPSQTGGVRKIAYDAAGWKPLRPGTTIPGRLPLSKIGGDTLQSFNYWKHTSALPHNGRWLDEIMSSGVTLEGAALRRTCLDIYKRCASDHNGISADVITSPVLP